VSRVDRRALALALVFFALFLFGALVAGKGDPLAPPRPSTLTPAAGPLGAPGTAEGQALTAGTAPGRTRKRNCPPDGQWAVWRSAGPAGYRAASMSRVRMPPSLGAARRGASP
jgi:hypothetical protein